MLYRLGCFYILTGTNVDVGMGGVALDTGMSETSRSNIPAFNASTQALPKPVKARKARTAQLRQEARDKKKAKKASSSS